MSWQDRSRVAVINGQGVPAGGTTGQILKKVDGTNYNTEWVDVTMEKNLSQNIGAENGCYDHVDMTFRTPTVNTGYAVSTVMFDISDMESIEVLDSIYKVAFPTFNDDGTGSKNPSVWFTNTKATKDELIAIKAMCISNYQTKFCIQITKKAGGSVSVDNFNDIIKINSLIKISDKNIKNGMDLFMFMGQSNMAGRGSTSTAHPQAKPTIISGAGFEFKAISEPTHLYNMAEPFGKNENVTGAINDGNAKSGSMVVALTNEYFTRTKRTIVGVSASEGGTSSPVWVADTARLNDAVNRLSIATTWLAANSYNIEHKYMVWCQGESDGDINLTKETYKTNILSMLGVMKTNGIEKMFLVKIGEYNGANGKDYSIIQQAQIELAQENEDIILVSTKFCEMKESGLMKDDYHYYQEGYNIVGKQAGANIAYYVNTNKEPVMFDFKNNNLYYSKTSN